jgi:hypothetical protein
MTDHSAFTPPTDRASDEARPSSAPSTRETHPLLGAFPLAVMTLAAAVVLFAFVMAALNAKTDPDLRASTAAHVVHEGQAAAGPTSHRG